MTERTCCDGACSQGRDCPLDPHRCRRWGARRVQGQADSHLSMNGQSVPAWRLDPHQEGHMRRMQAVYARQDALDRLVERAVLVAVAVLCAGLLWAGYRGWL